MNDKEQFDDISESAEDKRQNKNEVENIEAAHAFGAPSAMEKALEQQEHLAAKLNYCYNIPAIQEAQRVAQMIGPVSMGIQAIDPSSVLPGTIGSYCQTQGIAQIMTEGSTLFNTPIIPIGLNALDHLGTDRVDVQNALIGDFSEITRCQQELGQLFTVLGTDSINNIGVVASDFVSTIPDVLRFSEIYTPTIPIPPIVEEIQKISLFPIFDSLEIFQPLIELPQISEPDYKRYKQSIAHALFEARWFPEANLQLLLKIQKVLGSTIPTKKSKRWIRQVDDIIFKYYTKTRIESLRKSWRNCKIPYYMVKMMNQSVYAFYRKEYALTISTLVTLWEGFIADKTNIPNDRKISSKIKESMMSLIEKNGYETVFSLFAKEYIFYTCNDESEIIPDVPGRHATTHSWHAGYPSKKAALNAILFTNFLLKLRSLPDIKEENC